MSEFSRIAQFLQPLSSTQSGALKLQDDCALLDYKSGYKLAVTKDAIIENIHFLQNTDPQLLARKLLGVNLSDIAAMGAKPLYYFIAAALPNSIDDSWFATFTAELSAIQSEYNITLMGGDSVKSNSDLMLSLTMMGEVAENKILYRNQAKIGDNIYVTGTIGDAALGLKATQGQISGDVGYLINRYHIPQPRVAQSLQIANFSQCATDISDGLLADLKNICDCSNIGAEIYCNKIPLSPQAKMQLNQDPQIIDDILTGGDDYELLFTSNLDIPKIIANIQITQIGQITQTNNLKIIDNNGNEIEFKKLGFQHKL